MNEPLTMSRPGISFSGKTHNNHPQWYNQPLRLTNEQKSDPLLVLDDFFECYHLNDVRQLLWQWFSVMITSQRGIAIDPLDHDNHLFFYEKIEGIIEVAYVMKRKIHKQRLRSEKRKSKKGNQPEKSQPVNEPEQPNSHKSKPILEVNNKEDTFDKPKELVEHVNENPLYVITEVFKTYGWKGNEPLAYLRDQLRDWLFVAISADTAIYEEGEQRKQLLYFHEQLQVLIEAIFLINLKNAGKESLKDQDNVGDKPRLLTQEQIINPMQVVTGFFEKFPMVYIIRELNDWLEAGIAYGGGYPDNMSELQVLYTYRNVLCLLKAANRLLSYQILPIQS
ncbi:hypothetical protein [Niastella populi]|nr:hypothetical protein [Niastella populi]